MDVEVLKNDFDTMTVKMTALEAEKKVIEDRGTNGFHRAYNGIERKIKKLNKNMVIKAKEIETSSSGDFKKPTEAKL